MNKKLIKKSIEKYYDYTLPFYRIFWHKETNGIHYGFWDKKIKNHKESLLNTNKFLAEKAKIKAGETVLDAGCGIGGSSIWIAKRYDVKVIGITLSKRQLEEAKRINNKNKTEKKVIFLQRDFIESKFKDETFDVVWAIESICHAQDKREFLREAHRILKKNGRLVIDDCFLLRKPKNKREEKNLQLFLRGLSLQNLAYEHDFRQYLKEKNFRKILIWNKTKETLPSAKRIYLMSLLSYPISCITEKIGVTSDILTKNNLAGIVQYKLIKNGLMGHRVFYAEK